MLPTAAARRAQLLPCGCPVLDCLALSYAKPSQTTGSGQPLRARKTPSSLEVVLLFIRPGKLGVKPLVATGTGTLVAWNLWAVGRMGIGSLTEELLPPSYKKT